MQPIDDFARVAPDHARTTTPVQPRLDDDGLLWFGRRWVVIPDAQIPVVELILEHPYQLVRTATLKATYMRAGCSGHPASIRTMINRVVGRFARLGLTVHTVHSKGLIYEPPAAAA
jgi:hypothetical protein